MEVRGRVAMAERAKRAKRERERESGWLPRKKRERNKDRKG